MTTIFMQSVYNGNNEPPYLTNGRTIFLASVIVKYTEKNHDKTNPSFSEYIFPVPWPFFTPRFYCINKINKAISMGFGQNCEIAFRSSIAPFRTGNAILDDDRMNASGYQNNRTRQLLSTSLKLQGKSDCFFGGRGGGAWGG